MIGGSDSGRRVERALHLLDSLAAEAVAEGAYGATLSADQIRDVLLPLRPAASATADEEEGWAEQKEEAGDEADGHGEPCAHWVLMAQPQLEPGAPLGCYPLLEDAMAAAEQWSRSRLDWRELRGAAEFGFPGNRASWYASVTITRPEDLLDGDAVDLFIYPLPRSDAGRPEPTH